MASNVRKRRNAILRERRREQRDPLRFLPPGPSQDDIDAAWDLLGDPDTEEEADGFAVAALVLAAVGGKKLRDVPIAKVPDDCATCERRQEHVRDGGWCYMFREMPKQCAVYQPAEAL